MTRAERYADARLLSLARLPDISVADLRILWSELFETPAPKAFTGRVLRAGIAYRLQSPMAKEPVGERRAWADIERQRSKGASASDAVANIRSESIGTGTRFVREWAGVTHEVFVEGDGVLWNGKTYGSLSAVATAMTGIRRNGPRFFGLRDRAK